MKKTILALGLSLMTLAAVAQKREIRKASRAADSGDFSMALRELKNVGERIEGANKNVKAEFYYLKGKVLYSLSPGSIDNVKEAVSNLKKARSFNASTAINSDIKQLSNLMANALVTKAIQDQNSSKNIMAADKLMEVYKLDEANNLQYLYYAATNYHTGEELDKALTGYSKLLEVGYTGVETQYYAVEVKSGEKQLFDDSTQRDLMIKAGTHINPTYEVTEDVTPQILQYMAYIYIHKEEYENAIGVVDDVLKSDPENTDLLRAKADVLYQLGEKKAYKKLMQKIASLEPNNPNLLFNLGVSSGELGEVNEAIQFYDQVISLDANHYAANLNAAILILSQDEDIVNEMNSLGMSAADNKRYQELQKERKALMMTTIPYLENALRIDDKDTEVRRILANIYSQVGEDYDYTEENYDYMEGGNDYTKASSKLHLTKSASGTFTIIGYLNGLKLNFILDTGASDVSISATEAIYMLKNGHLHEEDILGSAYYSIANGDIEEGTVINIKELKLGKYILEDVKASVIHSMEAPLLLGQSALSRLGNIKINYSSNTLEIFEE